MTDAITGANQADYMKLFMQELTYQDPLKPVDNREFMTQMAQFSALQQAEMSNEALTRLAGMASANQALMLLGKQVKVAGSEEFGTVKGVSFPDKKPVQLSILLNGSSVDSILDDIIEVQ